MDDLDNVINRAVEFEREQAKSASFEAEPESEPKRRSSVKSSNENSAEEFAESLLVSGEKVVKALVDSRLYAAQPEKDLCRSELGPFIEKYNLHGAGDGKIPYREEWDAGWYLGGLFRRFKRAVAQLRAEDKAKHEAKQRVNNGDQRKHQTEKPAHAVPSQERVREEPNTDSPGWDSENWGAGSPVGQQ